MLRAPAGELQRTMSRCGCPTIAAVDSSILWYPYPDKRRGE